jgi:SAM-dependent methyltransferase
VIESPFETVDFPEGSVDCVAAFEVIEHVFSPRDFVTKCRRLLRKGGLLVLTCPNVKGFDFLVLGKDKADNFGLEHINMFHPAAIRLLLESCGFAVREVQTPGRLDADIVRGKILKGGFDVSNQPFLRRVLIEEWDRLGESFQRFLRENGLSSNLLAMAERT